MRRMTPLTCGGYSLRKSTSIASRSEPRMRAHVGQPATVLGPNAGNKQFVPVLNNSPFVCLLFVFLTLQPFWLYFHSPVACFSLLILEVSWSHTTRHSRKNSSGRVIYPSQRPLPDNTQHSQQTNIHAPDGILTHNLSRRAAEDLRLRPRGHWDRPITVSTILKYYSDIILSSMAVILRICSISMKGKF